MRIKLKASYEERLNKVIIYWKSYRVMGVTDILETYGPATGEEYVEMVLRDHGNTALGIVEDFRGN